MARGIALLAGVTSVDPAKYNNWDGKSGAKGCELDVDNMVKVISSVDKYEIKTLKKTGEPTSQAILDYIDWAANTLKVGDMFVFYYSGHGGKKIKEGDPNEPDGYDETLIVYDREICDDELAGLWLQFKPGVRIVMLSDSCNSGTNEGYIIKVLGATPPDPPIRKLMPISFTGKLDGMDAQLIHFGACRDGQDSEGDLLGGAFTLALVDVWKKKKDKFTGYTQLHEAIKAQLKAEGYPQEPQFNPHGNVQPDFLNSKPFSVNIEQA